ncbi:MAG: 50S ribosomal protein L31e [Candidatus Heimdallarchaeota archaeon]|nr:50S ribosomal protein L31e [Candidatus Heimdallarchaeota archaeon]
MSEQAENIIEERIYTVPFSKVVYGRRIPRTKRTPRAMRHLRAFIKRHLRCEDIIIDSEVNEFMWSRGIQKPPRKIRIRAVKTEEDVVTVYLGY